MSPFAPSVQRARPVRQVCRLARRAALMAQFTVIILAVAGPIPVGHDHGTLAANDADVPELVEHLERCHECISAERYLGWHLHWVWIGDESRGLTGASRTAASQTMLTGADSPLQSLESVQSFSLPWGDDGGEYAANAPVRNSDGVHFTPHFFSNFACGRSLPERLGVVRC